MQLLDDFLGGGILPAHCVGDLLFFFGVERDAGLFGGGFQGVVVGVEVVKLCCADDFLQLPSLEQHLLLGEPGIAGQQILDLFFFQIGKVALEMGADFVVVGSQVAVVFAVWRVLPVLFAIFAVNPLHGAIKRTGGKAQRGDAFITELV